MSSQDLRANLDIYSNMELHFDYYETTIHKNQYKTTFENGGYIECSLSYPKATIEPNLTVFDNGNKQDYQTDELFLFSTEKKTTTEEIIPEDEKTLLQAITQDTRFNKQFHKYLSPENNTAGILVIKHVPITNGQNPLYVIFILQKREQKSTSSINSINNIDEMVSHSSQSSDFHPFSYYLPPLAFSLNSIIYSSPFTNNKQNKTEHFTINDFLVNKSKNVYLMKNHLCEINLPFNKKNIKEGLSILGRNVKGDTGMTIDVSLDALNKDQGQEYVTGGITKKPTENIILSSYPIENNNNKLVCDYITPDEDKTEFYKRNFTDKSIFTYKNVNFIFFIVSVFLSILYLFYLLYKFYLYYLYILIYKNAYYFSNLTNENHHKLFFSFFLNSMTFVFIIIILSLYYNKEYYIYTPIFIAAMLFTVFSLSASIFIYMFAKIKINILKQLIIDKLRIIVIGVFCFIYLLFLYSSQFLYFILYFILFLSIIYIPA